MGITESITGGVAYRARIFDHGNYIKTVKVPDTGQNHFPATVHAKMMGFGEKTRLEFMINPKIQPKIFGGNIFEIDFDIRDSVQLGDLLDIMPDLVLEINKSYKIEIDKLKQQEQIQNAEFTVQGVDDLFEDSEVKPEPIEVKPTENDEEKEERPIDKVIEGAKTATEIVSTALPYLPVIRKFKDDQTQEAVDKIMTLCTKSEAHRKLLYWVPQYLKVEPEIHAIVSQSLIYQTGVMPSYYKAQSDAPIAEKMFTRPKEAKGWQEVAIVGLIVLGIIVTLLIATGKL